MVKCILLFFVLFFCSQEIVAQKFSPDRHLKMLLDSGDYFKFREEFLAAYLNPESNEADVQSPGSLYFLAWESYLFNRPKESNGLIESFLTSKGFSYSDSTAAELLQLHFQNNIRLFNYKAADSVCNILLFRYASVIPGNTVAEIRNTGQITAALVTVPPQTIALTEDLDIKYKRDVVNLIRIPVTMHNRTEDYIFDTGANFSTISESEAKKMGVRILDAKFAVTTSSRSALESKLGIADEMNIANATFRNVVFIVLPDKSLKFVGGLYKIKGIIGLPVIAQLKHIEITKDFHLRTNNSSTVPHSINLGLEGNTPFVNITFYGTQHIYIFDTGAGASALGNKFNAAYKDSLVNAKSGTVRVGGAGGMQKVETRRAKNVPYALGSAKGVIETLSIQLSGVTNVIENFYGIAGQDIFMKWDVMVIDFDKMFVELK